MPEFSAAREGAWQAPIVATTTQQNTASNFARIGGSFQIVNGCLSFVRGEEVYLPIFNRDAPPTATREGLVWGGRMLKYGQHYSMGGGSRPSTLPINEEARRACRGTFLSLWGVPEPTPPPAPPSPSRP